MYTWLQDINHDTKFNLHDLGYGPHDPNNINHDLELGLHDLEYNPNGSSCSIMQLW